MIERGRPPSAETFTLIQYIEYIDTVTEKIKIRYIRNIIEI